MSETNNDAERIAQLERDVALLYTRVRVCEDALAAQVSSTGVGSRLRWAERYAREALAKQTSRDDAA